MLFNILLIISSVLLGSSLSRILAKILVFQKGLTLFPSTSIQGIPLFTQQFADSKSYDLLEFLLFIVISLLLSGIFYFIYRKKIYPPKTAALVGSVFVIFAFILNIATLFVGYSSVQTIILILFWCLTAIAMSRNIPAKLPNWLESKFAVMNGIFLGFFLSILLHKFTTSVALPLSIFAVSPIYFYIFSAKYSFLKHPGWALLILGSMFPYNKILLFVLAGMVGIVLFTFRKRISPKITGLMDKIYPVLILFIFVYNPMFYFGSFDTVEEGFWAGWLQRMNNGLTMYRDFAIYHPPILPGGLYIFSKIFGSSLYNIRLYFHLLQIVGSIILYSVLAKLVKSNWIKVFIFALILAYGSSLVRNNMEFRIGSGLLPLIFVYLYSSNQKKAFLFIAGILSGLALLVSVETGIASIIAVLAAITIASSGKKMFANLSLGISGIITTSLVTVAIIYGNHSLSRFLEYVIFYARNFSLGYQNVILERPDQLTLIQWIDVNHFIGLSGFLWELTKTILLVSLSLAIVVKIKNKLEAKDVLFAGLAVFGIVLGRSALGRSDFYHIVFVWVVSLLLTGYLLDVTLKYSRVVPAIIITLLLFFIGRDSIQLSLIQNQLIKFQSYGNPTGSYPSYKNPREGILTGIEVDTSVTDKLVNFIDKEVNEDEYVYVFPHAPEIYFLSDRKNATSFDSPTIFFTPQYQKQTIEELEKNKPKLVIYNPKFSIATISPSTLKEIDNYINKNFVVATTFGDNIIMRHR